MSDSRLITDKDHASKTVVTEPLEVKIISEKRVFDSVGAEWNALVELADVHIFQTYEWLHTWWEIFGGDNTLHILFFRDGERLVGIAPLFLDCYRLFGVPVYRCLRMLGSRVIQPEEGSVPVELAFSDYLSLIVYPGYEREVQSALQDYLQSNAGLYDEIILEEIPDSGLLFTGLVPRLERSGWEALTKEASVCPRIHFPDSWDDLLGSLSSNARYQIRRDLRRVTDERLFDLKTALTKKEVHQAFEDLVEFHQRRWHALGQPGIFADRRILNFFREVTLKFHQKGWLLFKILTAEKECVAVDLLFKFKGTIYMIQRGFDDSSEYNMHGPGNVLLYTVIKEAIEDGFAVYDFLRGEESYKLRTANHVSRNREVILRNGGEGKSLRPKLNELFRKYGHLKRKLHNERHVAALYLGREKRMSATGAYTKELFRRGFKKIRSWNGD